MYVFKIMIRIPWDLLINIMKLVMHYQDIVQALDQLIFFSVPWAVSRRISDSRIGNWCFITILRRLGLLSSSEVVAIFILGGWSSYYRCWATLQGCNICRIDLLSFILVSVLYIFQVGWYLAHLLWISLYLWIFCTRYVVQAQERLYVGDLCLLRRLWVYWSWIWTLCVLKGLFSFIWISPKYNKIYFFSLWFLYKSVLRNADLYYT